jgi:hypothetical protein
MATGCILVYPMQLAIATGAAGDYIFQSFGFNSDLPQAFWLRKLFGFSIVCRENLLNIYNLPISQIKYYPQSSYCLKGSFSS